MSITTRIRLLFAGAIYHVYTRGVRRLVIFRDREDRLYFNSLLELITARYGVEIQAFALMDNHVHLLIRTPFPNLSQAMQALFGAYARHLNRKWGTTGHAFESRFFSPLVEPGLHQVQVAAYIDLNPVAAGMVAAPADFEWSSHRGFIDPSLRPKWLRCTDVLRLLHEDEGEAIRRYRAYVEKQSLLDPVVTRQVFERRIAIGSDAFRRTHGDLRSGSTLVGEPSGPSHEASPTSPTDAEILAGVEEVFGPANLGLREQKRPPHPARLAAVLVFDVFGRRRAEIGRILGGTSVRTVSRYLGVGRDRAESDPQFRSGVARCLARLGRPVSPLSLPADWLDRQGEADRR